MTTDSPKEHVGQALRAAESGSAGHWPTVAAVLHDEVFRLRAELERFTATAWEDRERRIAESEEARAELAAKDERIAVLQRCWDKARDANTAWLDGRVVVLPEAWQSMITNAVYFNYGPEPRLIDQLCELIESWRPATKPMTGAEEAARRTSVPELARIEGVLAAHGISDPGGAIRGDILYALTGSRPATEPAEATVTDYPDGLPERIAKRGCEARTWDRCLLVECDCGDTPDEPLTEVPTEGGESGNA